VHDTTVNTEREAISWQPRGRM